MATYHVGASGASVFNHDGELVARLQAGYVVVDGLLEDTTPPAGRLGAGVKRRRGYADKALRSERNYEDKAAP